MAVYFGKLSMLVFFLSFSKRFHLLFARQGRLLC
jgi:hypothetical protein